MNESRFYDGSDVLINKLGIRDSALLKTAEAEITAARVAGLRLEPIVGCFDLDYLQKLHHRIFSPLYSWAGTVRTDELEKATTDFCPADQLMDRANTLFSGLKDEGYLRGLSPVDFADRAAFYLGEVNNLHPFYEGNGRTQREFMYSLAKEAGHELDLSLVSKREMLRASFDYANGDRLSMRTMVPKQVLGLREESVLEIIDKRDKLKEILTVAPRPVSRIKGVKVKNPDIANEYKNLAKAVIECDGKWTGVAADKKIVGKLLDMGYPKYKVENTIRACSLEAIGSGNKAFEYAKNIVREVSRRLSR